MTDQELNNRCANLLHLANTEVREQAKVMFEALDLYQARDEVRGDLWREAGSDDNAHHLKSKGMRLKAMVNSGLRHKKHLYVEAEDEALDAINYAVFFVRNLRGA